MAGRPLGRGPNRPGYNPTACLGRVKQDELDMLAAAVYGDLKGAGGIGTISKEAREQARGEPLPTASKPGDDIVGSMAGRLAKVEAAAAGYKKEVIAKEKEILALKREVMGVREELKGRATGLQEAERDELEVLRIQNSKLALQVVEMTQFLKEQGYQWVGSGRVSPLCREGNRSSIDSSSPVSNHGDRAPTTPPELDRTVAQGAGRAAVENKQNLQRAGSGLAFLAAQGGETDAFSWGDTHKPRAEALDEDGDDPYASTMPQVGVVASASSESTPPGVALAQEDPNAMYFSVKTLKAKVAELNLLISEKVIKSESHRADGSNVVQYKDPDSIEVVLYSDGICVERGVFRPYAWPLCRAFLDDLLDGYFPYEYQERYPNGMVVKLFDKSDMKGLDHAKARAGQKGVQGVVSLDAGGEGYRVLSKDTFLSRVPKTRITSDGKIVNVRDGIAKALGVTPTADPATVECGMNVDMDSECSTATDAAVLLQVRIVGGGKLVAKLHAHSTIGDVRDLIAARMPAEHKGKNFELLTAFPRVTFSDAAQTLQDANLVPNAALLMRITS